MKPTIRDVAKYANVSISTVSRVMNAPNTVVEAKRNRVLEAIEHLQYQPNGFARGLIYKKSDTLGVMIPDIENPYYGGLLRGMQDAAVSLNCSLMICNTDRDRNRMISYIRSFYEKQVDGIIFVSDALHPEYYAEMKRYHFPIVLASTAATEFNIPSVDVNNEQGSYDAVKYLIELGHRRIGMISFPTSDMISGITRLSGYQRALQEAGLEACIDNVEFAQHRFEEAYHATAKLLIKHRDLTAIFTASDEFAMGAISYIHEQGGSVPDTISVIGFDNIRMASMFIPKLTTIAQPVYEIGVRTVEKLYALITSGEMSVVREKLPHQLIIRDSVKKINE